MIAARRIRERQSAERAGVPPPPERRPDVTFHQHQAELDNLRHAHSIEVGRLKARIEELEGKTEDPEQDANQPEQESEKAQARGGVPNKNKRSNKR